LTNLEESPSTGLQRQAALTGELLHIAPQDAPVATGGITRAVSIPWLFIDGPMRERP